MKQLRARLTEAQLAVMLLTRLPAGRMAKAPSIGAAVWAFPLAGLLVGGISAAVLAGALGLGVAPAMAAGLALAAGVLATGGLHEDGLADVADGFGGGQNRARKLEIMRDSQIGSYGGLALILSLGLRWQAMSALATHTPMLAAGAVIALAMTSRAGMAFALLWMPAARIDGMGKMAAGTTLHCALAGLAIGIFGMVVTVGPMLALWVFLIQIVVQLAFSRIAMRQIGGQSGDVLGAMQQFTEIAGWLVLAR
jgi:adenosylcobinamide-GDP ribazoletransferase